MRQKSMMPGLYAAVPPETSISAKQGHEREISALDQYWLHVPLETTPGMLFDAPPDKRLIIFGRPARLLDREPYISFISANAMVIKQWLLFDPMDEVDARSILADFRARLPALAMNMGANFRIPILDLIVSTVAVYDGLQPTLIPAFLQPEPAWVDAAGSCSWSGKDVLGITLCNSPSVTDKRILVALDLFIASQYDHLPRSMFLAKLTILDALASRAKRDDIAIAWIDEKITEAEVFDIGLANALGNLKSQSHTSAIKALVSRAVLSQGGSTDEAAQRAMDVGKLYAARSKMSHAGSMVEVDLAGATQLARFVLNAVINVPSVLD